MKKNWKVIILMLIAGIGWACFGGIVMRTGVMDFWIGWMTHMFGACMAVLALDRATDPPKKW